MLRILNKVPCSTKILQVWSYVLQIGEIFVFCRSKFCGFEMTEIFLLGTNFWNFLLKQKKINGKENVILSNVIAC